MFNFARTSRGFELLEFTDLYGAACSLQESSVATSHAVWLGVNDANPKILKSKAVELGIPLPPGKVSGWMSYPVPESVSFTTRMHLDRDQVQNLVDRLQLWLDTGSLEDEAT